MHSDKQHSWHHLAFILLVLLLAGTYLIVSLGVKNTTVATPTASVSVSHYTDVTSGTYDAIVTTELYQRDIFTGYGDGYFGVRKPLNRAEVAKILIKAIDAPLLHNSAHEQFADIEQAAWYAQHVAAAQQQGIVNGYPDGTYKPGNDISRVEFMKMLSEAFKLKKNVSYTYRDVNGAAWYAEYLGWYEQQGIFNPPILLPTRPITRLEAARALYASLKLSTATGKNSAAVSSAPMSTHLTTPELVEPVKNGPTLVPADDAPVLAPLFNSIDDIEVDATYNASDKGDNTLNSTSSSQTSSLDLQNNNAQSAAGLDSFSYEEFNFDFDEFGF